MIFSIDMLRIQFNTYMISYKENVEMILLAYR